ncbi:hypothetical protein ULF88_22035 [Halopseudomonas pachastrellae]|nr:hypothetical protein [Halopseudomonas pachastrellae]
MLVGSAALVGSARLALAIARHSAVAQRREGALLHGKGSSAGLFYWTERDSKPDKKI